MRCRSSSSNTARRSISVSNEATVEELLAHRAGLRGNADDDSIYGIFAKRASSGHGWQAAPKTVLSEYLLKDRLARHPGGRYSYSNTGYEILSAIIEEQTGQSYEDYCGEAVFGKLGLAVPKLHPDWRMLAGIGGWFVPGPGLSGLSRHLRSRRIRFSATPSKPGSIRRRPAGRRPTSDRWYSLGVNTWAGAGRWAVSHGGILHSRGKNAQGEPIEGSIVSHAFRAADGTAVFIALEWSPDAESVAERLAEGDRRNPQGRQDAALGSVRWRGQKQSPCYPRGIARNKSRSLQINPFANLSPRAFSRLILRPGRFDRGRFMRRH